MCLAKRLVVFSNSFELCLWVRPINPPLTDSGAIRPVLLSQRWGTKRKKQKKNHLLLFCESPSSYQRCLQLLCELLCCFFFVLLWKHAWSSGFVDCFLNLMFFFLIIRYCGVQHELIDCVLFSFASEESNSSSHRTIVVRIDGGCCVVGIMFSVMFHWGCCFKKWPKV